MRSCQIKLGCLLISCIANLLAVNTVYSIEITQPVTISATNASYDNQDLVINGSTLTIDGSHQFNSVQLINGAVLTHSISPASKLVLTSASFSIDATSSIDLTGKGNLPNAAVTGSSGGSYGGLGGIYVDGGTTNAVFGSSILPTDFGIGGIGVEGAMTYGGGSINLITDSLTLNGRIIANGQGFNTFFASQGGGSGGSILLNVGTLTGSGTLETSGGSGYTFYGGGGGGGGRIAVYYKSATFDFQNNIINLGGVCKPLFGEYGQPGSIFTKNTTIANQAPVANAGPSLAVQEQSKVTLKGSATDADGVITSYRWTQLSGPTVNLTNASIATATFIAPTVLLKNSPTVLQFRLTVTDDKGATATSDINIGVLGVNVMPVANAGSNISVNEQTAVTINGSGTDKDGNITSYQWRQISGPAVTLNNSNKATTSFTSPVVTKVESLYFRLTVTDNESGTHSDDVLVTVNPVNTLPVAKIVSLSPVNENTSIFLNGSISTDADGTISSYRWTQIGGPSVLLKNSTQAIANFSSPSVYQNTTLIFRLYVLDNDGATASTTINVVVVSVNPDDDADNMQDLWEIQFFNTLAHDGNDDSDNDGATDLQEYNFGTDPTKEQQPAQPVIISPDNIETTSLQPELILTNPNQHIGFPVNYQFEIYKDEGMTTLVTSTSATGLNWKVSTPLLDNTHYYWRARSVGTTLVSAWISSKFFINTANDAPGNFNISYPQDGIWVSSFTPTLSVTNSVDIDGDSVSYKFEVFSGSNLIASSGEILPNDNGTTSWTVNTPLLENNIYRWRATATDEHGLSTVSSSEPNIFINTVNDAPTKPIINSPSNRSEITTLYIDLIVNNATDPENDAIYYLFELDTVNTFDSGSKQSSEAIPEARNTTSWSINNLLDNTWYYWRIKANDGLTESTWTTGKFFVNQFNDAPGISKALNPGNHAWTGNLQPTLEVFPATDIDGDALQYEFNVYKTTSNNNELELVATGISNTSFWQIDTPFIGSGYYYWHARAIDEHGLAGEWDEPVIFFADDDGINDSPTIQLKNIKYNNPFLLGQFENINTDDDTNKDDEKDSEVEIKWTDYDPDSNAYISLYYDTDQYGEDGVLIAQNIIEDPDADSDLYSWDISQLPAGVYFIYAIIDDGYSSSVNYSANAIVIGDGGGNPYLTFKNSESEHDDKRNQKTLIAWRDLDIDSNAIISLYYDTDSSDFDGQLIADSIEENSDGKADHFLWDTSIIAEGNYYIYAVISDETSSYQTYSNKALSIKQHGSNGD